MKTLILAIMAAITLIGHKPTEYPETFIVVAVDQEHDFITLQDFNGFTWNWNSVDDWMIGDIASAIMDSNGTEEIQDDRIVMLKYSGYIAEP